MSGKPVTLLVACCSPARHKNASISSSSPYAVYLSRACLVRMIAFLIGEVQKGKRETVFRTGFVHDVPGVPNRDQMVLMQPRVPVGKRIGRLHRAWPYQDVRAEVRSLLKYLAKVDVKTCNQRARGVQGKTVAVQSTERRSCVACVATCVASHKSPDSRQNLARHGHRRV